MYKKTIIKPNTYYDSVTLMSLGSKIKAVEGVKEAVVVMATGMNKEILMNVGLGNEETEGATQNDLIIAVEARDEETCVEAHRMILDKLTKGSGQAGQEAGIQASCTAGAALCQAGEPVAGRIALAHRALRGAQAEDKGKCCLWKG